ncbi:polymerase [Daphne virus 1]|nr:polymerase [Daphne virus 1]
MNSLEDERPAQKYDDLPDYHLRNPLKSIIDTFDDQDVDKCKNFRIISSYKTIRSVRPKVVHGLSYELWTKPNKYQLNLSSFEVEEALADTHLRLEMDMIFNRVMDVKGMKESLSHYSKYADVDKIEIMSSFQNILMLMNALSSRRPILPRFNQNLVSRNLIKIRTKTGNLLVITSALVGLVDKGKMDTVEIYLADWIRCAADVATERFLLNFGSLIGNRINPFHYPSTSIIERIERWGDRVLDTFGNFGFKLLKTYEALCVGFLLAAGDDKVIDGEAFWKNTVRDLVEENKQFYTHIMDLKIILENSIESIHWISQLYGLHRIWGHPEVNSKKGMEKVIMIGQKNIILSDKMPRVVGRHFKMMIMTSFLKKHNRYPSHTYSGINKLFDQQLRENNPEAFSFPSNHVPEDLDNLELTKNFQLPETFNLSMIVADKSVSPTKRELVKNIKNKGSVMNAELRRGVLRWLNESVIDPRSFLERTNDGLFPEDHKIIGLTPKERELNPTPRMFALMSHLMRVYVVVTESMLSEHILPLFPQITMTDTLLDLNKKIIGNTMLQKDNSSRGRIGKRTICMSLDFEKWNGHMRKGSTFHVFDQLGKIFGLPNLYNATYDIFQNSYIYLADGSYVPRVDRAGNLICEEPLSFSNHQGGMEGLRQKGWTLFTIVCLDMICRRHNCTYTSLGMGDNQILMITFYSHNVNLAGEITNRGLEQIKRTYKHLFRDLMDVFGELGLPLKPLETWASESLFLYGKYPVWKGIPMSMDLKRIMRIFPFSNIDVMTIENMLNTVSGSATAATLSSPCVHLSYLTGLLMINYTVRGLFRYHPLTGRGLLELLKGRVVKNKIEPPKWSLRSSSGSLTAHSLENKLSASEYCIIMALIPRSLGGYLTFNIPAIMVRGFPDPLSRDLYFMSEMIRSTEGTRIGESLKCWSKIVLMPDINYQLLMEDVLSVNLLNPVTPMASVRQSVAKFLASPHRVKNQEFLDLMIMASEETKKNISSVLCSGDTLHIRLLHDIYESTIPGYVDGMISKVTKTSTVQKIAIRESNVDVTDAVSIAESNYFIFFCWRCLVEGHPWDTDCPTSYAKKIRQLGWKKQLKGVTIPFPLSFMCKSDCYKDQTPCNCGDGYLSVHVSDKFSSQKDWDLKIGNSLPYMGSMTKEKVLVQSGVKIYSSEPLVRRPVSLLRTINWFVPENSETATLIESCVKSVTDLSPEQFKGIKEGTSGAESHRYKDSSLSHGSLTSSNHLYSTRFHMSTDNMTRYSKGGLNYDLHYQSLLCIVSESTNQDIFSFNRRTAEMKRCTHWRQTCYECVNLVDEEFYDIKIKGGSCFIPYSKKNKYLYVERDRISYLEESRPYASLIRTRLSEGEYINMSAESKSEWLLETFSDKIISQINTTGNTSVGDGKTELHSGAIFNRVAYLKIDPVRLITSVAEKLMLISESRLIEPNDYALPSRSKIVEKSLSIINEAPQNAFLGLGLLLSWSETKSILYDNTLIEVDDDPPSLSGACESMRRLMSYIIRFKNIETCSHREHYMLIDEMKDIGIAYKLMMISKLLSIRDKCDNCLLALMSAPIQDYNEKILELTCQSGHIVLERYSLKIKNSGVTLDRLRKDSASQIQKKVPSRRVIKNDFLRYDHLLRIFESGGVRSRYRSWTTEESNSFIFGNSFSEIKNPVHPSDLMMTKTKPTASLYKYAEIFHHTKYILNQMRQVFLLGDGSGSTSSLYHSLFPDQKKLISTLIDSDYVIDQTMPHLFDHNLWNTAVDKSAMVNKVNDILNPLWMSSWSEEVADYDCAISDIEIIGEGRRDDRNTAVRKLLNITPWKYMIIKDYIYTASELISRLRIIIPRCFRFKLLSSQHKQRHLPECWWIISDTSIKIDDTESVCYVDDTIMDIWTRFTDVMVQDPDPLGVLTRHIDDTLINKTVYNQMLNRAGMHLHIKGVGCMIPWSHDFTKILGKLQTNFRPTSVAFSRTQSQMRMYSSREKDLTECLIILASSMMLSPYHRAEVINLASFWKLKYYKSKRTTTWYPYLDLMSTIQEERSINVDYVSVLNRFFNTKKMIFRERRNQIKFSYNKKRDWLCFPVAKNMNLRLGRLS